MSSLSPAPISALRLHFLIIGGGIAGVSTAIALAGYGHIVTVLEAQKTFKELGSGIQMPPNSTKILKKWGLAAELLSHATSPHEINFRSYRDGDLLSATRLIPEMQAHYAAPHLVLHRGDLLALLLQEARRLNVGLAADCAVADIDFATCKVHTVSGEMFTGDVLIGADGVKSFSRDSLLGRDTSPQPSGKLVYRLTVRSDAIAANPSTRTLIETPKITCWMGPDSHVICYNLDSKGVCNVVLTKSDENPTFQHIAGPQPASIDELHCFFSAWDGTLRHVLDLAESAMYWPLLRSQDVDTWTHPCGAFILIGDAAHSMAPHLVQGASQAIEDAACLAELFGKVQHRNQIPDALKMFQDLRQARCLGISRRAEKVGRFWTLGDGPYQQERDRQLKEHQPFDGYPNPFSDPNLQKWLYDYDIAKAVSEAWEIYASGKWAGTSGEYM
ncbi:FAD/NAD(P)-binding domain-containing protein, partial [Lentithecium fluviatile CBS 122367]